jgi:4-hydroxybenzoate polyprenyltransferase
MQTVHDIADHLQASSTASGSLLPALRNSMRALRPQHWVKNLLVFVPVFAAHRVYDTGLLGKAALAYLSFSFCASSAYVLNDILDLSSDRQHPSKRLRPFASGDLPLSYGIVMSPILAVLAYVTGSLVSPLFVWVMLSYLAMTIAYSLYLKKLPILDVIFLSSLYSMRLLGGSASVTIWPSHWLLAFSIFLFLSLALVKRYGELIKTAARECAQARGYELSDAELLSSMGIASGYLAVLVLALYITSGTAQLLYGRHELMWFLCPLLLYWISHVWLAAHRGTMHDDPVFFAIHNRTSRILILLMLGTAILAL